MFHGGKEKAILSSAYDPWGLSLSAKYSSAFIVSFLRRFISKIKTEVKPRPTTSAEQPTISKERLFLDP